MINQDQISELSQILFKKFYINDKIKEHIKKAIKQYATSNLSKEKITEMVNKNQNLANNLKGQNFLISKGKIAEYLLTDIYNKELCDKKRYLRLYHDGKIRKIYAKYYCTLINPDTTSKIDLLQIWIFIKKNDFIVFPFGDVKTGGEDYILNQWEKCINRNIPFIDTTGIITNEEKIKHLSKRKKDRYNYLYKRTKENEKKYREKMLIKAPINENDVKKIQKNMLIEHFYRSRCKDCIDEKGKYNFTNIYKDLIQNGVNNTTPISWRGRVMEIKNGRRTITGGKNNYLQKEDESSSNIKKQTQKFKTVEVQYDEIPKNSEFLTNIIDALGGPEKTKASVDALVNEIESLVENLSEIIVKGIDSIVNRVANRRYSKKSYNKHLSSFGNEKSPHYRREHDLTFKNDRYINMGGKIIKRKGSFINRNKSKT